MSTASTASASSAPRPPGGDAPISVLRVYSRLEVGGIERQMLRLLPRLNGRRYRVALCLLKRAGELADSLRAAGITVHVLPMRGRLHPGSLRELAALMRRENAGIVHAHVRESNTSATVAARMARVPVVIGSIHNMDTIRGWRRILQDRLVDRWRHAMVAVSERVRSNYCETVGIDPARVSVIYNGVDLDSVDAIPRDPRGVLGPMGIPEGHKTVICVARLVPQKAQEVLLGAARSVLERRPATTFLFVGEGPRLDSLRREAEALGIAANVLFAGPRHDVPRLLKSADLSVLTSTREGFSNVVVESLAAGLPVVATDVGGNAEAVEEGVSGHLLPVGDVDGIAHKIALLLEDDAMRARYSEAARARANRFGLDETIRATETLYDRLLRARGIIPQHSA